MMHYKAWTGCLFERKISSIEILSVAFGYLVDFVAEKLELPIILTVPQVFFYGIFNHFDLF
jgi:hypothetical protein